MVDCLADSIRHATTRSQGCLRWLSDDEFDLCRLENVSCSYRLGEVKTRAFIVTSHGRIAIIRSGDDKQREYSASDHVASLQELHVADTTVTMQLRGRAFSLLLPSDKGKEVKDVTSALNTVSLMLYSGPPPYKTSGFNPKVQMQSVMIVTTDCNQGSCVGSSCLG